MRDGLIESNPVKAVPRPKPGKPTVPVVAPDQADLALQGAQGKRIETLLLNQQRALYELKLRP